MTTHVRIATRGSALARWQAEHVAQRLRAADAEVSLVVVETEGDQRRDVPIAELAGRGVFVKEVQAAVLDGRADLAVHSAKDLTSTQADGLTIAAVPARADVRDALVGTSLAGLRQGATVATGSVRRRAQLAALRPDLVFEGLRGNIDTRLGRLDSEGFDAVVMAAAALDRLGRTPDVVDRLDPDVMVPQVGQGALALECRVDDDETTRRAAALQDAATRRAVDTERAFLATLGGGCDLPVGGHATTDADGVVHLSAVLAAHDGSVVLRESASGDDPGRLGPEVAGRLLERGGAALLEAR